MEGNQFHQFLIQAPLLAGGESSSDAADEAFLNSACDGISFRSLLTYGTFEPSSESLDPLKMPKTEPLFAVEDDVLSGESPPYNFFSDATPPSLPHRLPSLLSYEQPQNSAAVKSPNPNPRVDKTASYMKQRCRHQQQRPSDKTRLLQKLLPWTAKWTWRRCWKRRISTSSSSRRRLTCSNQCPVRATAAPPQRRTSAAAEIWGN